MARATATSAASLPGAATMDRPTGSRRPSPPGRLTCARRSGRHERSTAVRPRRGSRVARGSPVRGAGTAWWAGRGDGSGREQPGQARAGLGPHQRRILTLALGNGAGQGQAAGHVELQRGSPRSSQSSNVCQASWDRRMRCARDHGQARRGQEVFADLLHQRGQPSHHRLQRVGGPGVGQTEGIDRHDEPRRQAGGDQVRRAALPRRGRRCGRRGKPPVDRAWAPAASCR